MTKLEAAGKAYAAALATYRRDAKAHEDMVRSQEDYEKRLRELSLVKRASHERLYQAREDLALAAEADSR